MSLHLEFEPHSWYMGFAIKKDVVKRLVLYPAIAEWSAYTDNGNTYQVDRLEASSLIGLKQKIRDYHLRQRNGYGERILARSK